MHVCMFIHTMQALNWSSCNCAYVPAFRFHTDAVLPRFLLSRLNNSNDNCSRESRGLKVIAAI